MQINIAMHSSSVEQAEILRAMYFPDKTPLQIKDSFVFNQCLDNFGEDYDKLRFFIETEEPHNKKQRMLTIRSDSYEKLKTIANIMDASVAATYRAIIAYTIDNKETVHNKSRTSQLTNKLALLEKMLLDCTKCIAEIKTLIKEEECK